MSCLRCKLATMCVLLLLVIRICNLLNTLRVLPHSRFFPLEAPFIVHSSLYWCEYRLRVEFDTTSPLRAQCDDLANSECLMKVVHPYFGRVQGDHDLMTMMAKVSRAHIHTVG